MLRSSIAACILIGLFVNDGSAQSRNYRELPGQVVRDALAAADCPQTDVTTFGRRPASARHQECLFLALASVGCRRGDPIICFRSLWDELPPRRAPGASPPLVEPFYWTDDRIARAFAGYLPGTPLMETVRVTPEFAIVYERENTPPPPLPDAATVMAGFMIPFPHDPEPLVGSQVFAQTYGMELVPQPSGGWRIGRIALGSAAWRQDQFMTGVRVPEIAIQTLTGPQNAAEFPRCSDDICLDEAIAALVAGDFVRIDGRPMDIGRPPPPGAPWIRVHAHVSKRVLNERFAQQLALARTGLILADVSRANANSVQVIYVEPGGRADALGLMVGDVMRGIDRAGLTRATDGDSRLGLQGGPVEITFIRDGEQRNATLQRRDGRIVFEDHIATIDARVMPGPVEDPFAARDAVLRQRAQEARAANPFDDFHPDFAAVLQLIYDGRHREARALRRTYTVRGGLNPMVPLIDIQLAPIYALYQSRSWSDLPAEYGFVRAEVLGNCGDVVPRQFTQIRTRNGVEVGMRRNYTLYFLRGLDRLLVDTVERTSEIRVALGLDPDGRGWPTFFRDFPCGSPVIAQLDREMVAFAGRR